MKNASFSGRNLCKIVKNYQKIYFPEKKLPEICTPPAEDVTPEKKCTRILKIKRLGANTQCSHIVYTMFFNENENENCRKLTKITRKYIFPEKKLPEICALPGGHSPPKKVSLQIE